MDSFIAFCDLKRQYSRNREAFLRAIDSVCEKAAFIDGEFVKAFEAEFASFCDADYACCVNSGTNAILLALLALGIGPGDEVIVPANTFIATAWGPAYAGAKPVFVDCRSDTWEIDVDAVEAAITEKTKAVIGVHLYGMAFEVDSLLALTKSRNLYLVEDSAQAHGALYRGKPAGGLCDVGCFSFYPTKNLGAFGEGGCVTTDNEALAAKVNSLKNHGIGKKNGEHDEIGFNMRMDGIQAAILSEKLKTFQTSLERRRKIAIRYKSEIKHPLIAFQQDTPGAQHVYHLFVVTVDNRERFAAHLLENGIETSAHYRIPCHLQKAFAGLGYKKGDLPNAEYLAEHCVSLPIYPELEDGEVDRIIRACNSYSGEAKV